MAHTFSSHRIKARGQDDPNTSAGSMIGGIFGVAIGAFILALVCICCLKGINSSGPRLEQDEQTPLLFTHRL